MIPLKLPYIVLSIPTARRLCNLTLREHASRIHGTLFLCGVSSVNLDRRTTLVGLGAAAIVLCAWCSMFSAVGGWLVGRDAGQRQASAMVATALASQPDLPPLGVLVTRLDRTGAAARAGITRGDIIVAIDRTPIQDARDLRNALKTYKPGEIAQLDILHQQGTETVPVTLDQFPGTTDTPYLGIYYTARGEAPADL